MKDVISKNTIQYLMKNLDEQRVEDFAEFLENFFCNLDEDELPIKHHFENEIADFAEEVDEDMVREVIVNLRQKDGTLSGEKWNVEDCENLVKQYDVKSKLSAIGKQYDTLKFWMAMNYVYATHYSPSRTINGYIDLAIDEYANKNICFDTIIKKIFEKI